MGPAPRFVLAREAPPYFGKMISLRRRTSIHRPFLLVAILLTTQLTASPIAATADQIDGTFSTVVDQQGTLHTWGSNSASTGLLGNWPSSSSSSTNPVQVFTDATTGSTGSFVKVATGGGHTLAIDTAGELFSWGKNEKGQLGWAGNANDQPFLRPVSTSFNSNPTAIDGKSFVDVAAGDKFSLALDSEGNIYSWGANDQGQLGDGSQDALSDTEANLVVMPTLPAGVTFTSISAGKDFAVAVASNGHLYTWGAGEKMGIAGNPTDYLVPTKLAFFDDKPVSQVASSTLHTVVLTQSGDIWVFGDASASSEYAWGTGSVNLTTSAPQAISTTIAYVNSSGTKTSFSKPVELTFTSISAGPNLSAALDGKGQLYVWGGGFGAANAGTSWVYAYNRSNYSNGTDHIYGNYFPTLINVSNVAFDGTYASWQPSLSFQRVELGLNRALGVTSLGSLYSWGTGASQNSGELGLGSTTQTDVPTQITGGSLSGTLVSKELFEFTEPLAVGIKTVGANESFTLPVRRGNWNATYTYNGYVSCQAEVEIDWGDGSGPDQVSLASSSTSETAWNTAFTHQYASAGNYDIKATALDGNTCTSLFNLTDSVTTPTRDERLQMISLTSWGFITNGSGLFSNYGELTAVPSSLPSGVTSLAFWFTRATKFNGDISAWDISNVTSLQQTFYYASAFNQNLASWDTSNVTNFSYTFSRASAFNQPLNSWNVSSGTDFSRMFDSASAFNQSLSSWDVSNATNFESMFNGARLFNQDLTSWSTSNVTNMKNMFANTSDFNGAVSTWDTGNVTDMSYMFSYAQAFNKPLTNWTTDNVVTIQGMFFEADAFNQPIGHWNTSKVTSLATVFTGANNFNQPIGGWTTDLVTSLDNTFRNASNFNQDISNWNTANVTTMKQIFESASSFNQDISGWSTGKVTNFEASFRSTPFSGDLSGWDTSSATNMKWMFLSASSFNSDIGSWDTSSVTNMSSMFNGAASFNQDINYDAVAGTWNVANVTDMASMFSGATKFAYCLNWDLTGKITTSMFSSTYANAACGDLVFEEGSGSAVPDLNQYKLGFTLPPLPSTSLGGDTFLGWGLSATGCATNAPTAMSVDPTNLYAKWESDCGLVLSVEPSAGSLTSILPIGAVGCFLHVSIDWGDGSAVQTVSVNSLSTPGGYPTKTYATAGSYTISVTPLVNNTCTSYGSNDAGVQATNGIITGVSSFPQWIDDYTNAFSGAVNLTSVPTSLPGIVTSTAGMFAGATSFNQDISGWSTANVNDMSNMFSGATSFNQPLATWDTSAVTDFSGMFNGAVAFDQPIDSWDTASATDMANMFFDATAFNQDLTDWDVSSVLDFSGMFDATNDTTVLGYCLGWTIPGGATVTNMYGSSYDPTNCATIEFEVDGGSAVASFDYQASGFNLQTPPTTTKAGATFTGWSLSATDCQAATFPLAGPFSDPTKLYAVWSDCQVPQANSGSAPYTGPIVRSIGGKSGQLETQIGSRVRLDLQNTTGLTQVLVNGVPAEIVVNEAGEVVFIVPVGVKLGQNDLVLFSDAGRLTVQDAIIIKSLVTAVETASDVCSTQGPNAWTKRISQDTAKLYIKCGEIGTSYRVEVQVAKGGYRTLITRTLSSEADARQVFNDFGRYFVRSVSFYERLRIRIYGDGQLMWQVVYNFGSWIQ